MISKSSKERILKRLKQENARSPYLNSLPGRLKSYTKLDLHYLQEFNSDLAGVIVQSIRTGGTIKYYHNVEKTTTAMVDDRPIQRSIRTITDRAVVNKSETGSETLAVGYPMLLEKSAGSTTDCKAIPLFIWSVEVKYCTFSIRYSSVNDTDQHILNYYTTNIAVLDKVRSGESHKVVPYPGDATILILVGSDSLVATLVGGDTRFDRKYRGISLSTLPTVSSNTLGVIVSGVDIEYNLSMDKGGTLLLTLLENSVITKYTSVHHSAKDLIPLQLHLEKKALLYATRDSVGWLDFSELETM